MYGIYEWNEANLLILCQQQRIIENKLFFLSFCGKKKARRTKYYKMINWLSSWNWCAYAVLKCSLLVITSQRSIHDKESKTLFHLHVAVALNIALYNKYVPTGGILWIFMRRLECKTISYKLLVGLLLMRILFIGVIQLAL